MTPPSVGPETVRVALVAAEDLPSFIVWLAIVCSVASLVLLVLEMRRAREARRGLVLATGLLAAGSMLLAVLRPHRLRAREINVAARVVVLLDRSRSMALSVDEKPDGERRIDAAENVVKALRTKLGGHVDVMSFGSVFGPRPDTLDEQGTPLVRAAGPASDLASAVRAIRERREDQPAAIVVVSDGRLELGGLLEEKGGPPIHSVVIGNGSPPDASIRSVRFAGAAVAHQSLPLRVEVACTGGLACGDLTVSVRELRESDGESSQATDLLATGTATIHDGTAVIELPVTLERAGVRAISVSVAAPKGDAIPENDRRLLTIDVARERVRVLHIAGRPTYDVRALRTWLKSDAAMDVVSFFILRTPGDDVGAPDEELALIPFPVRELFTEYLPTFDAIIFQDFEAGPYNLTPHIPAIAKYVERGGGLVHVGGPNAFSAGGYSDTPLARVTPVDMPHAESAAQAVDASPFVPVVTDAGHAAPILAELESIVGSELPELSGTSLLGDVRNGGVALWAHPRRVTKSGRPMPVLAIGDVGDGRSIALGVDSTRRLAFSPFAAKTGGRGYDALWRGLLGWLMRDPRYEPVRAKLVQAEGSPPCLAGAKAALRIEASPVTGPARVRASFSPLEPPKLNQNEGLAEDLDEKIDGTPPILVPLSIAPEGAWALRLAISERKNQPAIGALATRTLAVCERGGDEWADPRPDREKLASLARASGGVSVAASDLGSLPPPKAAVVTIERTVSPILPAWAWGLFAAIALGVHWFARRRGGLS